MSNRLFFGLLYRKPSQNESWQGSWGLVGERSTKQCVSSASKTGFRDKMGGEAKLRLGHPKFWVFFAPQKHSKGFKHAHAAFKHDSKQTKIDRIFSAIFWKKLRGHFSDVEISKCVARWHVLCVQLSWLRTGRWNERSGWLEMSQTWCQDITK